MRNYSGATQLVLSIETISVHDLTEGPVRTKKWRLIKPNDSTSQIGSLERYQALITPISDSQILILGGCTRFGQQLADGVVYDVQRNSACVLALENFSIGSDFEEWFSMMKLASDALVKVFRDSRNGILHIASFSRKQSSSRQVENFKKHWHC